MGKYWIALLLAVAANVTANVALKFATQGTDLSVSPRAVLQLIGLPAFWLGMVSAATLLICYVYALKGLSLHLAYAVTTSLALGLITMLSPLIFHDAITWHKIVGTIMIAGGILLVSIPFKV